MAERWTTAAASLAEAEPAVFTIEAAPLSRSPPASIPEPREEPAELPPLVKVLLSVSILVFAAGTALALRRVILGGAVSVLDVLSCGGLVGSSLAMVSQRRLSRWLFWAGSSASASPDTATRSPPRDVVERVSTVAPLPKPRPTTIRRLEPRLQAVKVADGQGASFEPVLSSWKRSSRNACLEALRDIVAVREVHVARITIGSSGRTAPRVLAIAVASSMDAAESYAALYSALEHRTDEHKLLVWFVPLDSQRLVALRAAGCLVFRRQMSSVPNT